MLGSRFENNTFISDNDIDYGNGGSLGFQQTKGAVVVNNTFVNSQVVFAGFNQEAHIYNNSFENSNINFERRDHVFNNFNIVASVSFPKNRTV